MKITRPDRRGFLAGGLAATTLAPLSVSAHTEPPFILPEAYLPVEVRIAAEFAPYEIHVLPDEYHLYWTLPDQRAIRYSIGVARAGLYIPGIFTVGAKKEWPSWTPTPEMIERDPNSYAKFADGMPGGIDNPLGARALYLFVPGGGDTFLRIHGTNDARTIGRRVSNGCARLTNEHITELYERVPLETKVYLYDQKVG